jgi:hypothetical protein
MSARVEAREKGENGGMETTVEEGRRGRPRGEWGDCIAMGECVDARVEIDGRSERSSVKRRESVYVAESQDPPPARPPTAERIDAAIGYSRY